jgi:hypothetical protein
MQSIPRSGPLAVVLVALAVVFVVLAVLYAMGSIQVLVSDPTATHHYSHAVVMVVLAVVSLIGANFTRPRTA